MIEKRLKNKISNLEKLRIKRAQDEEYKTRLDDPLKVGDTEFLTGKIETEKELQQEREQYEATRTNPEEFLGKPVGVGYLKVGKIKSGRYSPEIINEQAKMISVKEKDIAQNQTPKTERAKYLSEKMERIVTENIREIFPNFNINVPAKFDDLFSGADITLFQQSGNMIKTVFSFDMFFQNSPSTDIFWKRKLFKNLKHVLNGNFSYINYLKSGEVFTNKKDVPGFMFPISKQTLLKMILESNSKSEVKTLQNIGQEIKYCTKLQIDLFKLLINGPGKKEELENILADLENSLRLDGNKPKVFQDETLKTVCEYLERLLKNPEKFLKNLNFYNDTQNLKYDQKNGIPKGKRNTLERREKNKKTKTFFESLKHSIGM